MISLRTKFFNRLCLSLLVMLASSVALVGCGGPGENADVEESGNVREVENQGDEDEGDRQKQNRSSDKDGDEDKDDDD